MKKQFLLAMALLLCIGVMGQQPIQLRSVDKAECVKSDMTSLKASFSFSTIEAQNIETQRGELSEIYIEGAYANGNVGEPQLPMFSRLIAIPTGAMPVVSVGAHSETQYTLSDYGIGTLSAMQAPVRKDVEPSEVDYAFSEAAYARNSYNDDPIAMVEVLGTMRGITLGRLIVQPVRYNPAAGTVKVFNDIEVSVNFENGDAESTMQMFKSTANVAFQGVYDQIFNIDMLMGDTRDAYTDHPDFYNTPVRMLVICYSGFKNNAALTSWLEWKLQKGYYVDIYYTDETGTTASAIASFIKTKYDASVSAGNAYTYLITIGDTGQIPQYMTKTISSGSTSYACASDLGYSSVNFSSSTSNYFPDMFYSRMSVENTTHLTNYINKVLAYEKFQFTDGGSYLNNVILVGGWDSSWTSSVAKPTINYGKNNYFNSSNTTYGGFENGTISTTISASSTQGYSGTNNGCYNGINNGVCFLNYTAHGDRQEWYQPNMTAAHVATLTNTGKYFFAVGNCCLTGNFNNTSTTYSPGSSIGTNACFAETMIRVPNAGAVAYIGCSPFSYWYEDFYWAVGAHRYSSGTAPSVSSSTKGVYDVMFADQYWNSASALNYLGNLAVQQAVTSSYTTSSITSGNCNNSAHYYFQFYHTFGDGSVMPYITKPETNTVTIPSTVSTGASSVTINALAGSYVAVTDNSSVIYGVAEANSSGVATVNFTNAIPGSGTLYVVVTRQQYQPYFGTIEVTGGTEHTLTYNPQQEHGTISVSPTTAYAGELVTLTATPDAGYVLDQWDVNTVSKGNVTVTDNQFIMPDSDVTISATFREDTECHAPTSVTYTNVTPETATISWTGENDSYNIRYRAPKFFYDFESAEPWAVDDFSPCTTYDGDGLTTYTISGLTFTNQGYTGSFIAFQNGISSNFAAHSGNMFGLCMDAMAEDENTTPVNNDWFILPALTIQNGDQFSFWARSVNDTYGLERIKVGVYSSNGAFSSYLAGSASAYIDVPVDWTNYTYDLSSYAGQSIQLAINCVSSDAFGLFIDDLYVGNPNGGDWDETITNVTSPYTLTGLTEVTSYEVQVVGVCDGLGESEGVGVCFTTPSACATPFGLGYYEVAATSAILGWTGYQESYTVRYRTAGTAANSFFDDFESSSLNNWDWTTYTNGDAFSGYGWFAYNPTSLSSSFPSAHSENMCALSLSYGNSALNADNYLVTPQLTLGGTLKFWIMSNYSDEYEVLLSTGGNAVSDFTVTLQAMSAAPSSWTEVSIDLSSYAGQQGYIAIHHVFYDGFVLFLDDFGIYGDEIPAGDWVTVNVDNPYAIIENLKTETTYEWQVQGNCSDGTTDWSESATFTTGSLCDAPTGLYATDVTDNSATLNWTQELDSYNVAYRIAPTGEIVLEENDNFDGYADWTIETEDENSGFYYLNNAHTLTGYGFSSTSTSQYLISPEFDAPIEGNGFVEFQYYATGTSDNENLPETFMIGYSTTDNSVSSFTWSEQLSVKGNDSYNYSLPEGAKYFAIQYISDHTSESSYLFIIAPYVVSNYIAGGELTTLAGVTSPVTINGLTADTLYVWYVQGADCDGEGTTTNWSSAYFRTLEQTTVTQTVALAQGTNWFSTYLEITLEDLEAAMAAQLGTSSTATIKSQDASVKYSRGRWGNTPANFVWDVALMYIIEVGSDIEFTLEGEPIVPSEHPITILNGANWIGFPFSESKDITTAFNEFAVNGDGIKSQFSSNKYSRNRWSSTGVTQLEPGQGYIYSSSETGERTLTYPTNAKKVGKGIGNQFSFKSSKIDGMTPNLIVKKTNQAMLEPIIVKVQTKSNKK